MRFDFTTGADEPLYHIRIDNREQDRALQFKEAFTECNCYCTIEQLPVGDYVFNDRVCFEYKTVADFISSINTRRVFNQAIDQAERFPFHFVLIVGGEDELSEQLNKLYWLGVHFTRGQFYGAIARLNTFTTVVRVPDEDTALQFMLTQAGKCLDGKVVHKELQYKTSNPAFNFLVTSVKGLGDKTTGSLVDELGLCSLEDLLSLTVEDLTSVKGVGDKTARIILEAIR